MLGPDYTVFGSVDEPTVKLIEERRRGWHRLSDGDGAPVTPVDISAVVAE